MQEKPLSSGQVSGLLGLNPQTVRNYIRQFNEFFSDPARISSPGRRFSREDINRLLLIRHLYHDGKKADEIRAALHGDWTPPEVDHYNNMDALALLEAARKESEQAKQHNNQARQWARQAQSTVESAEHILHRFKKVIERKQETDQLLDRLEALETRLKTLEEGLTEKQPRRGFLGWG